MLNAMSPIKVSMRPKGTTIQPVVRRRVAVSLLEAGWGVRQVTDMSKRQRVPSVAGAMPLSSRLREASKPNLIPAGVTPNSMATNSYSLLLSYDKALASMDSATTSGPWRGLRRSLNAASASSIVPPASGISCGASAGVPRSP
jgi:hypothetical protein